MKRSVTFVLMLAAFLAFPALAEETSGWAVYGGAFDVADTIVPEVGLEYRWRPFRIGKAEFVPAAGLTGTGDSAVWVYGNVRYDWELSDQWVVTLFTGVSLFEEGDGKDLGGPVEFRSGFEISRRFASGSRFGVHFYHLSHARIYEDNPGSNSIGLIWAF